MSRTAAAKQTQKGFLTDREVSAERLHTLTRVFRDADRTLVGKTVNVSTMADGPAPAWSMDTDIWFSEKQVGDVVTVDDVVAVTGLNFHELCHIEYTPSMNDPWTKRLIADGLQYTMNMLEDQRIESLMVAKYPSTAAYFSAVVMRWLLGQKNQWDKMHVLCHGRKYLPAKVRTTLADGYEGKHGDRLAEIIDEYLDLVYPSDYREGRKLIEEFHKLLDEDSTEPDSDPHNHQAQGRPSGGVTSQASSQQQKDAQDAREKQQGSGSGGDEDEDDADGDEDGDTTSGDSSEDGKSKGKDGKDDDDDSPHKPTKKGFQDKGRNTKPGKDRKADQQAFDDMLKEVLQDALDQTMQDERLQSEARDRAKRIEKGDYDRQGAKLQDARGSQEPIFPEYRAASKKFAQQLERLAVDADPGWNRHKSSGRLNMQRAMMGGDLDTLFDDWEPGFNQALDMEAVILFDTSASMGTVRIAQAAMAAWAIGAALQSVSAKSSIVHFDARCGLLWDRDKPLAKTHMVIPTMGGDTQPGDGLSFARRQFHFSDAYLKYVFILTDGIWGNEDWCNDQIDILKRQGVITVLGYLPDMDGWNGLRDSEKNRLVRQIGHGCHVFQAMGSPMDLVTLAKLVVKKTITSKKVG